jgi:hypothetical protein
MKFVVFFTIFIASSCGLTILEDFDVKFNDLITTGITTATVEMTTAFSNRVASVLSSLDDYDRQVFSRMARITTIHRETPWVFRNNVNQIKTEIGNQKLNQIVTSYFNEYHDSLRSKIREFNGTKTSDVSYICWEFSEFSSKFTSGGSSISAAIRNAINLFDPELTALEDGVRADLNAHIAVFNDCRYKWDCIGRNVSIFARNLHGHSVSFRQFNGNRLRIARNSQRYVSTIIQKRDQALQPVKNQFDALKTSTDDEVARLFNCYG